MACVVWLPTDRQVHGRPLLVSPQLTTTFCHGISRTSAATRARSITEWVPRLPTPDCTYNLPSGRIVIRPSKPTDPAPCGPTATPTPRTLAPCRLPARAA